jgi:TPP-dependent pyruvate/acetoin dehydrogenase alpha subunit
VEAVRWVAGRAIGYLRTHSKPFLLECDTTRLGRHKQGQGDLRGKDEIAELAKRDPLKDVAPEEREQIEAEVQEIFRRVNTC